MVHKVCSFHYKSYIFLWVHRPSVPKTLAIIFQCGGTVNGVWICMWSEYCRGAVCKHQFFLLFRREGRTNKFRQEYYFCFVGSSFIWNYPLLSLKNQKISNNGGEGGREISSVRHFVFFLHRRRGLHFFIGLCPKGSSIMMFGDVLERWKFWFSFAAIMNYFQRG